MLSMVILDHSINNGIHLCYLWIFFSFNTFSYVFLIFFYVFNLEFTPIQQSTALPPLLSDL